MYCILNREKEEDKPCGGGKTSNCCKKTINVETEAEYAACVYILCNLQNREER